MGWMIRMVLRRSIARKELLRQEVWVDEGEPDRPGWLRVALAFPSTYYVGMSNLGFQKVLALFRAQKGVSCERVFLPEGGVGPIRSFETNSPLKQFHLLAFSVSFEMDYLNVVRILDLAGIPPRRGDRTPGHPLVLAGGICPTSNPEPLSPVADLIALGEAEELLPEFLEGLRELDLVRARWQALREFARLPGIYVPGGYACEEGVGEACRLEPLPGYPARVIRRFLAELDRSPTHSVVLTDLTEFGGMFLIEVGRGCPIGCRFCLAGHTYRPFRQRSLESLLSDAGLGLRFRRKIGLMGSALSEHPHLSDLCREIISLGGLLSLSSMRATAIDWNILESLKASGSRVVTLAVEAATERLRRTIGKPLSDERLFGALEDVLRAGIPNLKLYFMVGLPGESEEDVDAIVSLAKRVKHLMLKVCRDKSRLGLLTLSLSPFVPKPFTPFEREPMNGLDVLRAKLRRITAGLRRESNIRVNHEVPKWSLIQGILSRGDRRVGEVLLEAYRLGGDWRRAMALKNLNPDHYALRLRGPEERLPWAHVVV